MKPLATVCLVIGQAASALALRGELPIEQVLTPAGVQSELPHVRPKALALSPDGRILATSGANDRLMILNPASGAILQTLEFPSENREKKPAGSAPSFRLLPDPAAQLSFGGMSFSPDGARLYLSDVNGRIKVFTVDKSGKLAGIRSFDLPAANAPRRRNEIPDGIAVSADGQRIYVAANLSNALLELDAGTGALLRRFDVGVAPSDVVLCGSKAYVSNWGGRRPGGGVPTGPAGQGTEVRVDPIRAIASEGSVSVVDLARGRVLGELVTGRHACALARSPDGRYVAVANANEDTVSIIDTRVDRVAETISLRWHPGDLFGADPNALAFSRDGRTLFVCNGTQNAVAVVAFHPGKSVLEGLIPVGWYPGAVACDPEGRTLYVANMKGEGREILSGPPAGYNSHQYAGSVSIVPVPGKSRLGALTGVVLADYRRAVMEAALLPARPGEPPRPVPERVGEPSVFRHVIYVIKENRTYDQVLGDMKEGDGDPALCTFGEEVTPNQHKLAREFVLLDRAACAGILSADGHLWATSAFASDYIERAFSDFPRSYPFRGSDALAYSPAGFIWDDAIEHGRSLRNYGEFTDSTVAWKPPHPSLPEPGYADLWGDYLRRAAQIDYSCKPGIASLARFSKPDTIGWMLNVSDQFRTDRFLEEFHAFEKSGDLPALVILYLPNDHTQGTKPGIPTPAAYVADNDLALGRVVDALSHGRYWRDTCLLAIEDDPQDGWDHVSGYRTTAYVASAYTKRSALVSDLCTQPGLLRTIELILGLPPMNQLDASAAPWRGSFTGQPDFTPFESVPNRVPLDELSPPIHAISDPVLRRDALVSARLPFGEADKCPEDVLNQILWRAQKGTRTPYPRWAVLAHPDSDGD